ncbi:glycosyltransferase family 2 protein [Halomicrobium urmianum]|uniref:glycosyltransferase family 2 protein n=1 Tax=Halomicrobium urmianum TaxID=1586233 RepID=UPI001CD9BA60|nr:glycosyltransferase family 2 protein [Halomicrobium urmianum]
MYRGQTVGVVLPAYNEADHVGSVIESLPGFVDRVYAIDDCSTDETWDVICDYATVGDRAVGDAESPDEQAAEEVLVPDGHGGALPEVVPVQHGTNQGAGGTLKTGYLLAARDGMDATVTIDADGQMDPTQMDRLLDPIVEGRAGFSKGNRLADADTSDGMPPFRLLGNWLLTLLMKPASGYWRLRDPQNGYTAISREALDAVDITAIPDDHDYPNDLLARLNAADVSVADVSIPAIYGEEESTIRFSEFVRRTSVTILRAFAWRLRAAADRGRPHLPVFYVAGVVGVIVGLFSTASTLLSGVLPGSLSISWPESALPLAAGLAVLGLALGADEASDGEVISE